MEKKCTVLETSGYFTGMRPFARILLVKPRLSNAVVRMKACTLAYVFGVNPMCGKNANKHAMFSKRRPPRINSTRSDGDKQSKEKVSLIHAVVNTYCGRLHERMLVSTGDENSRRCMVASNSTAALPYG